jgi:hypothetical protein
MATLKQVEIIRIATGLYRIASYHEGDDITITAKGLLEVLTWLQEHEHEIVDDALAGMTHEAESEGELRTLPGEQVPTYEGQEGVDWFHEDDVRTDNPAVQLDEE